MEKQRQFDQKFVQGQQDQHNQNDMKQVQNNQEQIEKFLKYQLCEDQRCGDQENQDPYNQINNKQKVVKDYMTYLNCQSMFSDIFLSVQEQISIQSNSFRAQNDLIRNISNSKNLQNQLSKFKSKYNDFIRQKLESNQIFIDDPIKPDVNSIEARLNFSKQAQIKLSIFNFTKNHQIIQFQCKLGRFRKKIIVLVSAKKSSIHSNKMAGFGTKSNVFCSQNCQTNQTVVKCLKFHIDRVYIQNNKQFINFIREYFISILISTLEIGPKVIKRSGFDFIMHSECLQFEIEKCLPLRMQRIQKDIKQKLFKLHMLNITHSDIKPANIMYSPSLKSNVLIDFGISSFIYQNIGEKTLTQFKGTFKYCGLQMKKGMANRQLKQVDLYTNDIQMLQHTLMQLKLPLKINEDFQFNKQINPINVKIDKQLKHIDFQINQQHALNHAKHFMYVNDHLKQSFIKLKDEFNKLFQKINDQQTAVKLLQKIINFSFYSSLNIKYTLQQYILSNENILTKKFKIKQLNNKFNTIIRVKQKIQNKQINKQKQFLQTNFQTIKKIIILNDKSINQIIYGQTQYIKQEFLLNIFKNKQQLKKYQITTILHCYINNMKNLEPQINVCYRNRIAWANILRQYILQLNLQLQFNKLFDNKYQPQMDFTRIPFETIVFMYSFMLNYCISKINIPFSLNYTLSMIKQCIYLQIKVYKCFTQIIIKYIKLMLTYYNLNKQMSLFSQFIANFFQFVWIFDNHFCVDRTIAQNEEDYIKNKSYKKINFEQIIEQLILLKQDYKLEQNRINSAKQQKQKDYKLNQLQQLNQNFQLNIIQTLINFLKTIQYVKLLQFQEQDQSTNQIFINYIKDCTVLIQLQYKQSMQHKYFNVIKQKCFKAINYIQIFFLKPFAQKQIVFNIQFKFKSNLINQSLEYLEKQKFQKKYFRQNIFKVIVTKSIIKSSREFQRIISIYFFFQKEIEIQFQFKFLQKGLNSINLILDCCGVPFLNNQLLFKLKCFNQVTNGWMYKSNYIQSNGRNCFQIFKKKLCLTFSKCYQNVLKCIKTINKNINLTKQYQIISFLKKLSKFFQTYFVFNQQSKQQLQNELYNLYDHQNINIMIKMYILNTLQCINIQSFHYYNRRKKFLQIYLLKMTDEKKKILQNSNPKISKTAQSIFFYCQPLIASNKCLQHIHRNVLQIKRLKRINYYQSEVSLANFWNLLYRSFYISDYQMMIKLLISFCQIKFTTIQEYSISQIRSLHYHINFCMAFQDKSSQFIDYFIEHIRNKRTKQKTNDIYLFECYIRFLRFISFKKRKFFFVLSCKMFESFYKFNNLLRQLKYQHDQHLYFNSILYIDQEAKQIKSQPKVKKRFILIRSLIKKLSIKSQYVRNQIVLYIKQFLELQIQIKQKKLHKNKNLSNIYSKYKDINLKKKKKIVEYMLDTEIYLFKFNQSQKKYQQKLDPQQNYFMNQIQSKHQKNEIAKYLVKKHFIMSQKQKQFKQKYKIKDITPFNT